MFDLLRKWILRFLRVPPEPHAPAGASGSLRSFRAARNYYRLRVLRWMVAQVATMVGIGFSIMFIRWIDADVTAARARAAESPAAVVQPAQTSAPAEKSGKRENRPASLGISRAVARFPDWSFSLLKLVEAAAIVGYVVLIPITFAAVRLDYDYRWYLLTDRSLRIRTGIWRLQEITMSFANLQQVEVSQGPLQRLLGLADVRVKSAGGGGGGEGQDKHHESMHEAVFHGLDNAVELRDLMLDRLRRFREAGLGDPDDEHADPATAPAASGGDALLAAQAVLAEARALRAELGSRPSA